MKTPTQTTNGIKISIRANFEGIYNKDNEKLYAFTYEITIENISNTIVQLKTRHWEIFDSLNFTEIVEGEGVIGKTPIIIPGNKFIYTSGCMLHSPVGAMKGFYTMLNFTNFENFQVQIPTFKLSAPFILN